MREPPDRIGGVVFEPYYITKFMKTYFAYLLSVVFLVLSVVSVSGQESGAYDTLKIEGEQERQVLFLQMTNEEVVYDPRPAADMGVETRNPIGEMESYEFGEVMTPSRWTEAQATDDSQRKVELLGELLSDWEPDWDRSNRADLFRQLARLERADELYYEIGNYERALTAYEEFTSNHPGAMGIGEAVANQMTLYMELGQYDQALTFADEFVSNHSLPTQFEERVDLHVADVQYSRGNYQQAHDLYEELTLARNEPIVNQARLGRAKSLVELEQYGDARDIYRELVNAEGVSKLVRAGAHNGLGRVIMEQDVSEEVDSDQAREENLNRINDALLHFFRPLLQYQPEAGEDRTEFQRALLGAAQAFFEKSRLLEGEQRETATRRAAELAQTLLNEPRVPGRLQERARRIQNQTR